MRQPLPPRSPLVARPKTRPRYQHRSMWLQYGHESNIEWDASLLSLQQRPQVAVCPLLAPSPSLQGTTITC